VEEGERGGKVNYGNRPDIILNGSSPETNASIRVSTVYLNLILVVSG
jgi:hypothetical protein